VTCANIFGKGLSTDFYKSYPHVP